MSIEKESTHVNVQLTGTPLDALVDFNFGMIDEGLLNDKLITELSIAIGAAASLEDIRSILEKHGFSLGKKGRNLMDFVTTNSTGFLGVWSQFMYDRHAEQYEITYPQPRPHTGLFIGHVYIPTLPATR